jgi:hypothetical protein
MKPREKGACAISVPDDIAALLDKIKSQDDSGRSHPSYFYISYALKECFLMNGKIKVKEK